MLRSDSGSLCFCALVAVSWSSAVFAADLPTADEILRIHRTNKARLSQLHLQLVHRDETTEASCRYAQKEVDAKERFLRLAAIASLVGDLGAEITVNGKKIKGKEARRLLRPMLGEMKNEIANARRYRAKPVRSVRPMEFFLNGDDYQFRTKMFSPKTTDEEIAAWRFPNAPLTAATLLTTYRNVYIFSRSKTSTPAARWWSHSADDTAYVTKKHLTDVMVISLPPFTDVTHPRGDMREAHAFDAFFSQPVQKYRVVREDEIDGRRLVVVDVAVPLAEKGSALIGYRGWLDLKRGALPVKMYRLPINGNKPDDRLQPSEIITTQQIRKLPNGAYYPAKTVREEWHNDPEAPELTEAEMQEVRAGKRKLALAVHRRHTWECSLVEVKTHFDDGFFILPFPPDQKLYDHDAGKMIGALDKKPLVMVGQPAPPLSIAHWLDGKQRALEDLRGQVVVLHFWGLWCGACRGSVPKLKTIQDRFRGKPVTFIGIHNAEKDPKALSARIQEFQKKYEWKYLAAIDTGKMLEDSVTTTAYGIRGFPTLVIVGPDGRIIYVDPDLEGPACYDKDPTRLAKFQEKFNGLMKEWFHAVGETWPIPEGLDDAQQEAIYSRVYLAFIARRIDSALAKAR